VFLLGCQAMIASTSEAQLPCDDGFLVTVTVTLRMWVAVGSSPSAVNTGAFTPWLELRYRSTEVAAPPSTETLMMPLMPWPL